MEIFIGIVLALAVSAFGTLVGFDRDRVFYPTILIVIALLYALFAAIGGSFQAALVESPFILIFVLASVLGFKFSLWLVVGGLAAHGVFDFIHRHLVTNPGVPKWWPMFCLTYDLTAAAYLAWLLRRTKAAPSL